MKRNIIVCLIALSFNFTSAQEEKPYEISDEKIWIEFTTKWTWNDLVSAKSDAKAKDIMLSYQLIEFDENGFLRKIKASIKYPDGMSASVTSRVLQEGDVPGLRRDLIKNPF